MFPTCTYSPPNVLYDSFVPHTLYEIGILWFPLPYMEQLSYGLPHRYIWSPHICEVSSCLIWLLWSPYPLWNRSYMVPQHVCMVPPHVLYDSYGPPYLIWNRYFMVCPYLIWNRYCLVPHMYIWYPHMWSVFMSYMPLMVPPFFIWNRYGMVPPYIHMFPPHVQYDVNHSYGPHTLYGIGIWWSPLPYMEQLSYDPPHVCMVPPHVRCLHVLYHSYGPPYLIWNRYHMVPWHQCMVPLTLYGTGIVWFPPHVHMVPSHVKCLHVLYDSYGPPYLIWNRYCMIPLTCTIWLLWSYGPPLTFYRIGIIWSPPTCMYGPLHIWSVFIIQ